MEKIDIKIDLKMESTVSEKILGGDSENKDGRPGIP